MRSKERLEEIIRCWNPETDSIHTLKDARDELGPDNQDWIFEDMELLSSLWADKYTEFSYNAVSSIYSIIAVDHEGYCIFGDCTVIKHVSELEKELKTWEQEQEAENASNKN